MFTILFLFDLLPIHSAVIKDEMMHNKTKLIAAILIFFLGFHRDICLFKNIFQEWFDNTGSENNLYQFGYLSIENHLDGVIWKYQNAKSGISKPICYHLHMLSNRNAMKQLRAKHVMSYITSFKMRNIRIFVCITLYKDLAIFTSFSYC